MTHSLFNRARAYMAQELKSCFGLFFTIIANRLTLTWSRTWQSVITTSVRYKKPKIHRTTFLERNFVTGRNTEDDFTLNTCERVFFEKFHTVNSLFAVLYAWRCFQGMKGIQRTLHQSSVIRPVANFPDKYSYSYVDSRTNRRPTAHRFGSQITYQRVSLSSST